MTDQDFDFIRKLLRDRSAITLEDGKQYLVESRLAPLVRELKLGSIGDLVVRLRAPLSNGLQQQVVEAMVTTETTFFRDLHPFEALRKSVIPDLIRKRQNERRLNIWCAACSTGQEPYSVALLIREHFPELAGWKVNILATDLSRDGAGPRARRALQPDRGQPRSARGAAGQALPAARQLVAAPRRTCAAWSISRSSTWSGRGRRLPRMDLVFMRNVMIYFDVETKKAILGRMTGVLQTGRLSLARWGGDDVQPQRLLPARRAVQDRVSIN